MPSYALTVPLRGDKAWEPSSVTANYLDIFLLSKIRSELRCNDIFEVPRKLCHVSWWQLFPIFRGRRVDSRKDMWKKARLRKWVVWFSSDHPSETVETQSWMLRTAGLTSVSDVFSWVRRMWPSKSCLGPLVFSQNDSCLIQKHKVGRKKFFPLQRTSGCLFSSIWLPVVRTITLRKQEFHAVFS